jgi:acetylglutamate kinase
MDPITVVKVGGNEIDDVEWTARLAASVAAAPSGVVIVHGGGKEISELQRALGAEPEWRDGLRVTTPQTLRAVSMVLSGWVNKRLVSVLIGAGRSAVGLSGQDGPILVAEPAQEGRLGLTGTVTSVHPSLVLGLLRMGVTPVVSPVSRGPEGGPLNVNADDAAAAIAGGDKGHPISHGLERTRCARGWQDDRADDLRRPGGPDRSGRRQRGHDPEASRSHARR